MDYFFVEYRDPLFGLIVLVMLILVVALGHYFWRVLLHKDEEKTLDNFIKKFEIENEHKHLLRTSSLNLTSLHFLARVFSKSGEFEKAVQIYLIALEKTKNKNEQELIFYDLAQVYFKAGFLQRSAEVLLNALKNKPRNIKALKLLKIVYLRLKNFDGLLALLESLFELGEKVDDEKAFIKLLQLDLTQNLQAHLELAHTQKHNALIQRFIFEHYQKALYMPFELAIDLLYKYKKIVFLEDKDYEEFFSALKLIPLKEGFEFKNHKLKMLYILKNNNFKAKLDFFYLCTHCKNQMPLFFYHCPICYEFNQCKIIYEVKADEENSNLY